MIHKPILIKNLSLILDNKVCFEDFNTEIFYKQRIAIIGINGTGKTSLINYLHAIKREDLSFGYIPQLIKEHNSLSGGQSFNKMLNCAMKLDNNILLLD